MGEPYSTFLCIVHCNGTAECIHVEEAIQVYLIEKELPINKMMGFGSDGAAVLVATRQHHNNIFLVFIVLPTVLLWHLHKQEKLSTVCQKV